MTSGRSQMLATRNFEDWHTVVDEVPRSFVPKTAMDCHSKLVLHWLRNNQPVDLRTYLTLRHGLTTDQYDAHCTCAAEHDINTQSQTDTDQPCSLVFFGIRSSGGSRQLRWWCRQQLSHLTSRCWLWVFLHVSHLSHSVTWCRSVTQCHMVSLNVTWCHICHTWCHSMSDGVIQCHMMSFNVRWCHSMSHGVTQCHICHNVTQCYMVSHVSHSIIRCQYHTVS